METLRTMARAPARGAGRDRLNTGTYERYREGLDRKGMVGAARIELATPPV